MIKTQEELINVVSKWAGENNNTVIHIKSEVGLGTAASIEDAIEKAGRVAVRFNASVDEPLKISTLISQSKADDVVILIEDAEALYGIAAGAITLEVLGLKQTKRKTILLSHGRRDLPLDQVSLNRIMHLTYEPRAAI